MSLERDYSIDEVAEALGMSVRWVRERIKVDHVEHVRRGHKIRFTAEQVERFRTLHTVAPATEPVTTGRKKRAS